VSHAETPDVPSSSPHPADATSQRLIDAAALLRDELEALRFAPPVAHVYNPLQYAWEAHAAYLSRYGQGHKKIMFLGMNPGPFGMMQTGVPFGEVSAVRDWMGIEAPVQAPPHQHPKRPIDGFACTRSEVSGRRLWGWIGRRFGHADDFFAQAIVINYCPLVFLEASGKNRTPVQLPVAEQEKVIGRTKYDDIEMDDEVKPTNSHIALNVIEDEDGNEQAILRANLPFGNPSRNEYGTFFIGYARSLEIIEQMLTNMFIGRPEGNYDRLLDYSRAVTGTAFFVPSASFLEEALGGD